MWSNGIPPPRNQDPNRRGPDQRGTPPTHVDISDRIAPYLAGSQNVRRILKANRHHGYSINGFPDNPALSYRIGKNRGACEAGRRIASRRPFASGPSDEPAAGYPIHMVRRRLVSDMMGKKHPEPVGTRLANRIQGM